MHDLPTEAFQKKMKEMETANTTTHKYWYDESLSIESLFYFHHDEQAYKISVFREDPAIFIHDTVAKAGTGTRHFPVPSFNNASKKYDVPPAVSILAYNLVNSHILEIARDEICDQVKLNRIIEGNAKTFLRLARKLRR